MDKSSGGSVTRTVTYYPAGGAMRINSTLYYILKDHLGSASVVTDSTGTVVGEQRYYPFGETRLSTGTIFTDKLFTGQQEMAGLGIYNYGARFYSPKLGRFLSADTIVLDPTNPQDLNRFSYVRNNPLKYTDPTGHTLACDDGMGGFGCAGNGVGDATPSEILDANLDNIEQETKAIYNYTLTHPEYSPLLDSNLDDTEKFFVSNAMFLGSQNEASLEPDIFDRIKDAWGNLGAVGAVIIAGIIAGGSDTDGDGNNDTGGGSKIIQYGGHTVSSGTLEKLGIPYNKGGAVHNALKDIRDQYGLPNTFHGNIAANGDYIDPGTGTVLGNIFDFMP